MLPFFSLQSTRAGIISNLRSKKHGALGIHFWPTTAQRQATWNTRVRDVLLHAAQVLQPRFSLLSQFARLMSTACCDIEPRMSEH
jgi:hypothetical protein